MTAPQLPRDPMLPPPPSYTPMGDGCGARLWQVRQMRRWIGMRRGCHAVRVWMGSGAVRSWPRSVSGAPLRARVSSLAISAGKGPSLAAGTAGLPLTNVTFATAVA